MTDKHHDQDDKAQTPKFNCFFHNVSFFGSDTHEHYRNLDGSVKRILNPFGQIRIPEYSSCGEKGKQVKYLTEKLVMKNRLEQPPKVSIDFQSETGKKKTCPSNLLQPLSFLGRVGEPDCGP